MKTLLLFLLSALTALGQSVELRGLSIEGAVDIGSAVAAAAPAGPFSPTNIAGMLAWYDAEFVDGTAAGGRITNWTNRANDSLHLIRGSGAVHWMSAVKDTHKAVYFSNDTALAVVTATAIAQPLSVFMAGRFITTNDNDSYFTSTNANNPNYTGFKYDNNVLNIESGTSLDSATGLDTNVWVLASCIFTNGQSILRINGTNCITGDAGTNRLDGIGLMSRFGINAAQGYVLGCIIYTNNVAGDDLTNLENWFRTNYTDLWTP